MALNAVQYDKTEALGRALQLAAYDETFVGGRLLDFYQQIAGPIADKQFVFWRDGTGDVGFVCWGLLDRYGLARYCAGIWPIQHKTVGANEKYRYIFAAISPFMDREAFVNAVLDIKQSDEIHYFMTRPNASQHDALFELKRSTTAIAAE